MLVGPCYDLFRVIKQVYVHACCEGVLGSGGNAATFLNTLPSGHAEMRDYCPMRC